MLCNAHDDMSHFSIRSKQQRCYNATAEDPAHLSYYVRVTPVKQGPAGSTTADRESP